MTALTPDTRLNLSPRMNATPALSPDYFGQRWSTTDSNTIDAWNRAFFDYLTLKGNPVADALALRKDDTFVMGDVFALTMMFFDGEPRTSPRVEEGLARFSALFDRLTPQEQGHILAVQACSRGQITEAAKCWDEILDHYPYDLVAMRLAHETYFLVGDAAAMLESTSKSMSAWRPDMTGYGFVLGQHAFALEECHQYAEAEGPAILALEREPEDLWALHALIHVYEMQDRHADCLDLIERTRAQWTNQPLLIAHIWWHLALRYVATERYEEALAIYDEQLTKVDATSAFRLTDGTSLLWRLELAGQDVGNRWEELARKWLGHADRHANGFLDVHIAMALASAGRTELQGFLAGLGRPAVANPNELDEIRLSVTIPVCQAIVAFTSEDHDTVIGKMAPILPHLHRIGGSNAQRDLFHRTLDASKRRTEKYVYRSRDRA